MAIPLQEKITGDSKLICIQFPAVILFQLVFIDSIDFSKLKKYDFCNLCTFFTLLQGNTSLLLPATFCLEHEITTLKTFVKISKEFFWKRNQSKPFFAMPRIELLEPWFTLANIYWLSAGLNKHYTMCCGVNNKLVLVPDELLVHKEVRNGNI